MIVLKVRINPLFCMVSSTFLHFLTPFLHEKEYKLAEKIHLFLVFEVRKVPLFLLINIVVV